MKFDLGILNEIIKMSLNSYNIILKIMFLY